MIRREQIEELPKMPVDERLRVLQLLQASLPGEKSPVSKGRFNPYGESSLSRV
jgi:hypothetical protein